MLLAADAGFMIFYINHLTLWSAWPLWRSLLANGRPDRIFYFKAGHWALFLLGLGRRLGFSGIEEIDYSLVDVKSPDGVYIDRYVEEIESAKFCDRAAAFLKTNPLIDQFGRFFDRGRLQLFLERSLAEDVRPVLTQLHIVAWHSRRLGGRPFFLTERTPWLALIQENAARLNIGVSSYVAPARPWHPVVLKVLRRSFSYAVSHLAKIRRQYSGVPVQPEFKTAGFKIAVSYQGKGVSFDLSKNTDLFWAPFMGRSVGDIVVYFAWGEDPLDEEKWNLLDKNSILGVAMNAAAHKTDRAPLYSGVSGSALFEELKRMIKSAAIGLRHSRAPLAINLWIIRTVCYFSYWVLCWRGFFELFQVKINVNYDDWSKDRLAADEAIAGIGGISVSYQRADETIPDMFRARSSDVHFSFAYGGAESEIMSRSRPRHFVWAGYPFDGAFAGVRPRAARLRQELTNAGAKFIVCFLDENSKKDKKAAVSSEHTSENYRFLLEKFFADPGLGLVFKPKKAATLRSRLGDLAALLDRALSTKRCFIFEEGNAVATTNYPCEAGLASDVTIGVLGGTTAALESALAGSRTLLIDREGLPHHPWRNAALGRIVFLDWDSLWGALGSFRENSALMAPMGDWSQLLNSYDAFRDGRAGERIGSYIGWLSQGIEEGLSASLAMDQARQRYVGQWGPGTFVDMGPLLRMTTYTKGQKIADECKVASFSS
ncbi:MAG: hypothetical protein HY547_03900 [Elusimicrobia bacterium]|nr:hypothetical protein [Elusimicrobiota bacterium]